MKCRKCGHRAKDINGMRKHYMKAHPGAMKRRAPRRPRKGQGATVFGPTYYCPHCGGRL